MRRALAALAAVPLIFSAAACGSSDTGANGAATTSASASSSASTTGGKVKVTGAMGAKPTVTFPPGAPATTSSYEVLDPGNGPQVKSGDKLIVNLTIYNWDGKGNALQGSSYDTKTPETIPVDQQLPQVLQEGFTKLKHGGRMMAVLAADPAAAQQQGQPPQPTKVFVFDVVGSPPAALKAATGKETGDTLKGVKVVNPGGDKAPTLTTKTSDKPSKDLVVKTIIKGTGKKVLPTQTLVVQYTGKIWGTDAEFDSSWGKQPATFPLSGVIQGWQKGLAGVPVGSRVVMSIPPELGYGAQEQQGIPANSTLVFVVDILSAY